MSDARPITNITDYVCSNCWNSFSRTDPGVLRGSVLVCPHCSHKLPVEGAGDALTAAVVAAAASHDHDSDSYGAPQLPESADGFPSLDTEAPIDWAAPRVAAGAEPAGFVVGESDDSAGFTFDGPTLRPDQDFQALIDRVVSAPAALPELRLHPSVDGPQEFVAGEELGADTHEKTPLETDFDSQGDRIVGVPLTGAAGVDGPTVRDRRPADAAARAARAPTADATADDLDAEFASLAAAFGLPPAELAPAGTAESGGGPSPIAVALAAELAAGTGTEAAAVLVADGVVPVDELDDAALELRDWKLKAMGLTYNFHGLDALIGWATNKVGQSLAMSHDGVVWRDFSTFFEAYRSGVPVGKAFEGAADASAAPAPVPSGGAKLAGGRTTGTMKSPAPPNESGKGTTPRAAPTLGADDIALAALEAAGTAPSGRSTAVGPASRSTSSVPAQGPASAGGKAVGPATSPSRRAQPVAKASAAGGPGAKIAIAVVGATVVVLAVLHVLHVVKIPGLP